MWTYPVALWWVAPTSWGGGAPCLRSITSFIMESPSSGSRWQLFVVRIFFSCAAVRITLRGWLFMAFIYWYGYNIQDILFLNNADWRRTVLNNYPIFYHFNLPLNGMKLWKSSTKKCKNQVRNFKLKIHEPNFTIINVTFIQIEILAILWTEIFFPALPAEIRYWLRREEGWCFPCASFLPYPSSPCPFSSLFQFFSGIS